MNTILHLGLGSFHRAHQAVYVHQLRELTGKHWSIAAGNLRPDMLDTIAALQAQSGAYTLETITPQGERSYTRITSIERVISYQDDLAPLVAVGADPATRIISFTVTEAGYYLDDQNRLDWVTFPDLRADLDAVKAGRAGHSIYGGLVTLLRARMHAKAGAITLMNCDNLRHNGDRSRGGLLQFIEALGDSALLTWVTTNTTSPNAMVDRITPRPTPEVAARVKAATGQSDPAALMGESFIQWVIEDNFIAGRPDWEKVGVEMVQSVQAHEEAKIRLLNATHSCIAWAGTLAGLQYIHEGTHHPAIRKMAYDYVTDDAIPVLMPCPINLEKYRDVVLDRFGNPAIADTNQRVAMDAFSKIPGMIAPTIRDKLAQSGSSSASIRSVAMLPALFLAYLQRWHQGSIPYTYQDQAMDTAAAHAICSASDPIAAYAADPTLWGELASDPRLIQALRDAYARVQAFIQAYGA
ncbi:D-arabinitol 4-dehydrogenase [Variovorax sp. PCZ-1]|uniref:D-arabinitol 4-dehydrogenase n=1 Tax=Variovorax sp. PCZ-1 TaxID=2835533 RepID=UPI001BCF28FB|nr:D-arabinitol 4-dehydrogenase [Variovorax sp. PCZ-1]MBS7808475.1 mannitol dehydrogenase family protein [Variovorax sp. PCZ-1]